MEELAQPQLCKSAYALLLMESLLRTTSEFSVAGVRLWQAETHFRVRPFQGENEGIGLEVEFSIDRREWRRIVDAIAARTVDMMDIATASPTCPLWQQQPQIASLAADDGSSANGALKIAVRDGAVQSAGLMNILEPPRFFESLLRGAGYQRGAGQLLRLPFHLSSHPR